MRPFDKHQKISKFTKIISGNVSSSLWSNVSKDTGLLSRSLYVKSTVTQWVSDKLEIQEDSESAQEQMQAFWTLFLEVAQGQKYNCNALWSEDSHTPEHFRLRSIDVSCFIFSNLVSYEWLKLCVIQQQGIRNRFLDVSKLSRCAATNAQLCCNFPSEAFRQIRYSVWWDSVAYQSRWFI